METTTTVDELLDEIQKAEAGRDYRDATIERMRALIQAGAYLAYLDATTKIIADGAAIVAENPATADALTDGLQAAVDEGQRILALLGADIDALGGEG